MRLQGVPVQIEQTAPEVNYSGSAMLRSFEHISEYEVSYVNYLLPVVLTAFISELLYWQLFMSCRCAIYKMDSDNSSEFLHQIWTMFLFELRKEISDKLEKGLRIANTGRECWVPDNLVKWPLINIISLCIQNTSNIHNYITFRLSNSIQSVRQTIQYLHNSLYSVQSLQKLKY